MCFPAGFEAATHLEGRLDELTPFGFIHKIGVSLSARFKEKDVVLKRTEPFNIFQEKK